MPVSRTGGPGKNKPSAGAFAAPPAHEKFLKIFVARFLFFDTFTGSRTTSWFVWAN
jgi:hypothetical protein